MSEILAVKLNLMAWKQVSDSLKQEMVEDVDLFITLKQEDKKNFDVAFISFIFADDDHIFYKIEISEKS